MSLEGKIRSENRVRLFAVEEHCFSILPEFDDEGRKNSPSDRIGEKDPVFFISRDLAERYRISRANSLMSKDYTRKGDETFSFSGCYFHNLRISSIIESKEHIIDIDGRSYYSDLTRNRVYELHDKPYEPAD